MKRIAGLLMTVMVAAVAARLCADVSIEDRGSWPETWPKELEPLRAKARTIEGPLGGFVHYEIPFARRDAFESAWTHLLKVRSAQTPLVLMRGPYTGTGANKGSSMKAGVLINSYPSPRTTAGAATPDAPPKDTAPESTITTTLVLVVDGDVVDLNRIPLPPGTHIQDERFKNSGATKR